MLFICLTSANDITEKSDADLLEKCISEMAKGDKEALATLYGKTKDAVYAYALSVLKNTHDAEDVLHDCYVNIFTSAHLYKNSGKRDDADR